MPNNPAGARGFDRRRFLGMSGGFTALSLLGGLHVPPADAAGAALQPDGAPAQQRTLVVVELQGGNDALNTLVPSASKYHDLRPTVGISDDDLIEFAGLEYGVNASLSGLERFWDAGQLAAIYGVGLPEQSRSHFVAQDAWRSGLPGEPATSGWLGRWLEANEPSEEVPLRAIALGASTLAAQGEQGRPVAVQSVAGYRLAPPRGNDAVVQAMLAMSSPEQPGAFGLVQQAMPATIQSVDELQELVAAAADDAADDGDNASFEPDSIEALFAAAQAIIAAEVGTQVLYLTIGDFDTHSLQRARQDQLLESVGTGLASLFESLEESGHAEQTLGMVITEFGRRAAENGSQGTDHGKGGLSFMVGPAVVESAVHGGVDLNDLDDGDLPITSDARSMYSDALRWLGTDSDGVRQIIGDDAAPLNLLRS